MRTATIEVGTVATLKELLEAARPSPVIPDEVTMLILQSPAANAAVVNFGDSKDQPFELSAAGERFPFPLQGDDRINLNDLYISGTGGDILSVAWIGFGKES